MTARRADPAPAEVHAALARLDGSTASAVSLLTGLSADELDELGGLGGLAAPPHATPNPA